MNASKVYPTQFSERDNGRAHYFPEDDVQLGDVGFYQQTNGRFYRLFNCLVPSNHPLNSEGVPAKFKPFELKPSHVQFNDECLLPQPIVSKSVVSADISVNASGSPAVSIGAGMTYKCQEEQGAVVLFGSRLARAEIRDNRFIRQYMLTHVDSWYDFAFECGFGPEQIPEGSIIVIRGCDKAPSFALAAFSNQKKEASISFQGGFIKDNDFRLNLEGSWERTDSAEYRSGAPRQFCKDHDHVIPPTDGRGQPAFPFFASDCVYTLFSRIYKIKRKKLSVIPTRIKAAAGPHQLPRGDFDKDASSATPSDDEDCLSDWSEDEGLDIAMDQTTDYAHHPLDDLVDLVLKMHPELDAAIVTDDDFNVPIGDLAWVASQGDPNLSKVDIRECKPEQLVSLHQDMVSEESNSFSVHNHLSETKPDGPRKDEISLASAPGPFNGQDLVPGLSEIPEVLGSRRGVSRLVRDDYDLDDIPIDHDGHAGLSDQVSSPSCHRNPVPNNLPPVVLSHEVGLGNPFAYIPNEVQHRKRTTRTQFRAREDILRIKEKPEELLYPNRAEELTLSPRAVQAWFQNWRAKERNQMKPSDSISLDQSDIGADAGCSSGMDNKVIALLGSIIFYSSTAKSWKSLIWIPVLVVLYFGVLLGWCALHIMTNPFVGPTQVVGVPTGRAMLMATWPLASRIIQWVLFVRLLVVYSLRHNGLRKCIGTMFFPIMVKTSRLVINTLFLISYGRELGQTSSLDGAGTAGDVFHSSSHLPKIEWLLEVVDNAYVLAILLWRFRETYRGMDPGQCGMGAGERFMGRIRRLFWLAASYSVFPVCFEIILLTLLWPRNIVISAPLARGALQVIHRWPQLYHDRHRKYMLTYIGYSLGFISASCVWKKETKQLQHRLIDLNLTPRLGISHVRT